MTTVATELNRIVGDYWTSQAGIARRARESASKAGMSPGSPVVVSAILRESLILIEPKVVERFLGVCDDEGKLQIESGIPRDGIVNPFNEAREKAVIECVSALCKNLKRQFHSDDRKLRQAFERQIDDFLAVRTRTNVCYDFKKKRREFEIRANAVCRERDVKARGVRIETIVRKRASDSSDGVAFVADKTLREQPGMTEAGVPQSPILPDGPFSDDGFRWCGVEHRGLTAVPFRLVNYLWRAKERTASFDELAEPVWRDHAREVTENMVGSARRDANAFFEGNDLPFKLRASPKGRTISLKDHSG